MRLNGACVISNAMASNEELLKEIERLLVGHPPPNRRTPRITLKVSQKGALSVYGMGRFPVTLYREQWEKLLAMSPEIRAFIRAHDKILKKKEVK